MKKKITAICLCVALVAVAVVGASLAYFTDTDSAKNTFTVGNVKIDLIEQETGKNGLQDYTDEKTLVPGTQTDGNAVSKIVTVENNGNNAAWVWVEIKVPTVLVSKDILGASKETFNALHWNSYGYFTTEYHDKMSASGSPLADGVLNAAGEPTTANMVAVEDGLWNDFKYVGIEGNYTVFRATMDEPLASGKISLPCLRQAYMDWRLIANDDGSYTFPKTKTKDYSYDGAEIPAGTKWEILVNAYAIQADGIASVDAAVAAYANNGK